MSYQYSLNNLRTNSPYYSLNNLNTENGIKDITAVPPIMESLTGSNASIELYESSPNLINFATYNKSLQVEHLYANSGTISNISATGVRCDTLYATTSIYSNGSLNAPFGDISCYGITANLNGIKSQGNFTGPAIFCNSGTFNSISANNITINTMNIPNLTFVTATGTNLYSQNMSGTTLYINKINSTLAGRIKSDTFEAQSSVLTPYINLQNAAIWSPTNNDIEIASNNAPIYFRRSVADASNQAVYSDGSFFCPTGAFTNLIGGITDTSNLIWSLVATGATAHINDLYATNAYLRNVTATGTFKGNFKVKNPDSIEFLDSTNTQICKITPSATTSPPSLSYSTTALVGSQLQQTMTTNGTTMTNINALSAQTLQSFDRSDLKQLSVNYVGSLSNTATINGNASIGYLSAAPSNGLIVSGNSSIGTASNVNKLDVSGGLAVGSYAGVNTAPTNGMIVSGNVGIGTGTTAQTLSVNGDASVNNGSWFNRINIASNNKVTTNKGYELDCQGYQHFYTHNQSNGFQLDLGASGTYSNFRSAYLYKPDSSFSSDTTIYLVNQQNIAGNAYAGAIQLAPNNGFGTLTCYGNGQTVVQAKAATDYACYFNNATTSNNGYGLRVDNSTNGLYLLQLNGKTDDGVFNTALTVHSEGGNNGGVVISAYPVAPSNTYKLWVAPMRNNSIQDTFIGITNQTFRANGTFQIGMATGSSSLSPCQLLSTTTANHIDLLPNFSQRARFSTNGEIFFNAQSTTTASAANSTLTLTSVSYYGGGGTSYHTTNGLGSLVPLVNIYFNGGFAIPAGANLLAATEYYRTNHSAWIGAPTQRLNCDWTGKYSIKANITLQTDTAGGAFSSFYLYINGGAYTVKSQSHIVVNGYISFTIVQDIQLSTGDNIQFYLYVSAGNDYVLGGSNVSMRYIG